MKLKNFKQTKRTGDINITLSLGWYELRNLVLDLEKINQSQQTPKIKMLKRHFCEALDHTDEVT